MTNKVTTSFFPYILIATAFMFSSQSCRSTSTVPETNAKQDTQTKVEPPTGEIASFKVQIVAREGKCVFKYDGSLQGQIETALPAPCEFNRDQAGKIRSYEYKNTKRNGGGTYFVILLIGGPVATDGRPKKLITNGCGSQAQAISLSPRGVALAGLAFGLDICPTDNVDEVMFASHAMHI